MNDVAEQPDEPPLPRPRKLPSLVEETPERLTIRVSPSVWQRLFGGGFLLFWLTGWTVGCVFLVGMVIEKPELRSFLFATPFLAAWFAVVMILYWMFFERESATFEDEGLRWEKGVPGFRNRRFVPLAEILDFCDYVDAVNRDGRLREWIEAETTGRPIRFSSALDRTQRLWLIGELKRRLDEARRRTQHQPLLSADWDRIVFSPSSPADRDADPPRLTAADAPLEPPGDSSWARIDEFDAFEFTRRGRFEADVFFVTLFINLFWNGIVSVFISVLILGDANGKLEGGSWWGMFLFLVPFEAIGLLMFVGLLAAMLEPWHRTRLIVGRNELITASTWLGIGRLRTTPIGRLDRLEVRRIPYQAPNVFSTLGNGSKNTVNGEPTYGLTAVDDENRETAEFTGLTLGEACWIAGAVMKARGEWFR